MNEQRTNFKIPQILKKPLVTVLSILLVGTGLFLGIYTAMQDNLFQLIHSHEMRLMSTIQLLGSNVMDAKLADMKGHCEDMLVSVELGLLPTDTALLEPILREVSLPEDGLNLAYWRDGILITQDEAFRADLEALDLASVMKQKEARIFNPYFDEAGNYVLTVAAATEAAPGVFIVQYDAYCMSSWLRAAVSHLEYGTAYIVDSEGYNIAAAREENLEWVTTRYNAQQLAAQDPSSQNISIAELEGLALAGKTGIGSYEWEGGISQVAYGPLSEAPWGYYVGFYEWEFTQYNRNVAAISSRSGFMLLLTFGVFMGAILILVSRSLTMERKYNQVILLQKLEAENRSIQDSLTGVKNNRAWQEACQLLDREIASGTAEFAIVVCDVNGLKQINDTLGHEAGDSLIVRACSHICGIFSHSPVFRIGGDEFTVILQRGDLRSCETLIEEFRRGLAEQSAEEPPFSIALGISHYQPGDAASSEVFHRADKAMYENKNAMKAK